MRMSDEANKSVVDSTQKVMWKNVQTHRNHHLFSIYNFFLCNFNGFFDNFLTNGKDTDREISTIYTIYIYRKCEPYLYRTQNSYSWAMLDKSIAYCCISNESFAKISPCRVNLFNMWMCVELYPISMEKDTAQSCLTQELDY